MLIFSLLVLTWIWISMALVVISISAIALVKMVHTYPRDYKDAHSLLGASKLGHR